MYAVIFTADVKEFGSEYTEMATKMRDLAINEYNCIEFISCAEGKKEISISYWENMGHIKSWKNNIQHLEAQELGRNKWYSSYKIEITKIGHSYTN